MSAPMTQARASHAHARRATRSRAWRCRWCSHVNPPERVSFCESCWNGRTQLVEDMLKDKLGLPRVTLTRRSA